MKNIKEYNNIKDMMTDVASQRGEEIVFTNKIKEDKTVKYEEITYTRLLEDINSLGTSLYENGFENSRIAIAGRNRYEWIVAHLANLMGGIVSVPLDKELKIEEFENSLIRSKAKAIIFDEKYVEMIEEIKNRNNTEIKEYISMAKLDGYKDVNMLIEKGKKAIKSGNRKYINCKIDENKMSILLFTSGTTSKSKAVMLSQKNIASNIYALQQSEDFYDTDVNIAILPFHHIFGQTGMLLMIACGVKTVFTDGLRYIGQNFKEYGVSVFVGVPLLVESIYKNVWAQIKKQGKETTVKRMIKVSNVLLKLKIDIRKKVFKSIIDALGGKLRFVICGGAPLDKKIEEGFRNFGIEVAVGYGLTETAPVIAAQTKKSTKPGSVGVAMPNVNIEIVDKDENGIGEITAKGPNIMLGYYEDEEKTNEVLKNGAFYTGDLGYIDKDGALFITGRKKDMIVLKNGKKVFPDEIETIVNRLEFVKESMVFGLPDKNDPSDIQVAIKIVYDENVRKNEYQNLTDEEFKEMVWNKIKEINKTFPMYKYIKHLVLTDEELIKTTTKKIRRQEELKTILSCMSVKNI
jgi:long-chain acyl-CoA synthetase